MSCNTCQKIKVGARMLRTTDHTRIAGKDGRARTISAPLFEPSRAPRSGWSAMFTINGQPMVFPGRDGYAVFRDVRRTLDANGIKVRDLDLWLNLNLVWLGRAIEKHQQVTLPMLLALTRLDDAGDKRIFLTNQPA